MKRQIEQTPKRITFVTAEMAPFAKVGGLADVAGALPLALAERGHIVSVYLPLYGVIDLAGNAIRAARENEAGWVQMGDEKESFQIFVARKSGKRNLTIRFIASNRYFGSKGVYFDENTGEQLPENDSRYIFFQKAVIRRLEMAQIKPDIVHCNDHQTGLLPYLLQNHPHQELRKIATVFSIHNLAYQGLVDDDLLEVAGIPKTEFFPMSPFEYYGKLNQLKAGLHFADMLTTVSPTYAEEIQENPEQGADMQEILKKRSSDLIGILNGVNYKEWDSRNDPLIPVNYGRTTLGNKEENKRALRKKFGLSEKNNRTPLLGMITRLVDQKGMDILIPALEDILEHDLQVVFLGFGEKQYHTALTELRDAYQGKLSINLSYDNELAHLIEAGSDIFLMPSKYEPCGLNQLYSLKYGTIPVVHATGGLKDTVKNVSEDGTDGTGFVFDYYSKEALLRECDRALTLYQDQRKWQELMKRAMREDFSWDNSASLYETVYEKALQKREVNHV
jgi:starch synthase